MVPITVPDANAFTTQGHKNQVRTTVVVQVVSVVFLAQRILLDPGSQDFLEILFELPGFLLDLRGRFGILGPWVVRALRGHFNELTEKMIVQIAVATTLDLRPEFFG